jgi:hypothetical protein
VFYSNIWVSRSKGSSLVLSILPRPYRFRRCNTIIISNHSSNPYGPSSAIGAVKNSVFHTRIKHVGPSSMISLPMGYIPAAVNSARVFTKALTSCRALFSSSFTSHNLISVFIFLIILLSFRFLYLIPLITECGKCLLIHHRLGFFYIYFNILTFRTVCGISWLVLP